MKFLLCVLLAIAVLAAIVVAASAAASIHPRSHRPHPLHHPHHPASSHPTTSSATLYFYLYDNSTCSNSNPEVVNSFYSGACLPNEGNTSYTCFCDAEAGYFVAYNEGACETSSINSVVRYEFGCRADGQQAACVNPELGPPIPFTWPLAAENFIIQTQCTDGVENYCSSDEASGVVCTYTGSPANICVPFPAGTGSSLSYCTADESWLGYVQYTSTDCSGDVAAQIQLTSTVCNETFSNTQCRGSPLPQSQYPSLGSINYNNPSCTASPAMTIGYQSPDVCVDAVILECNASNSTMMQSWYGSSSVLCPAGVKPVRNNFTTGECVDQAVFFCDGSPIQI